MHYRHLQFRHLLVVVILLVAALLPYWAFAQGEGKTQEILNLTAGEGGAGYSTDQYSRSIGSLLANVINGFFAILGVLFLLYLIYGGYIWMTARGNEEDAKKAQGIIQHAITGIIVIVAAYAIVYFVLSNLLGFGGGGGGGGQAL